MRRLLTTLMILLAVVVAGLSALVLLVNPNDFRAYMVEQVKAKSGYELVLEGPLRWHVWPQLSILSEHMSLTAPGANTPVVSAENMRLDVALWPLLSHQLQVNQVFVKGAVVQLTPATEAKQKTSSPIAPKDTTDSASTAQSWSFDIAKLQIVDSILVFEQADEEQVTVRNLNLKMTQDTAKQAAISVSSQINRDQREFAFSLESNVDLSHFPQQVNANISSFEYQLTGAELPTDGIKGSGSTEINWQNATKNLALTALQLTVNDSDLKGEINATLQNQKNWHIALQSERLNLDNLLPSNQINSNNSIVGNGQSNPASPVIANDDDDNSDILRQINADVSLNINTLQIYGLAFNSAQTEINNQNGLVTIKTLSAQLDNGKLSLPGVMDIRQTTPQFTFQPQVDNVPLEKLLKAFNYPTSVSGQLTMKGEFSGNDLTPAAFRQSWMGNASISLTQARIGGMNFQQLIEQAISRSNDGIQASDNYDNATLIDSVKAQGKLNKGNLTLSGLSGTSRILNLTGYGALNLASEWCDMSFNIRINSGWRGSNSKLIAALEQTNVPLRIYGPWQNLSYTLQVEQLLRDIIDNQLRTRTNQLLNNRTVDAGLNGLRRALDKF